MTLLWGSQPFSLIFSISSMNSQPVLRRGGRPKAPRCNECRSWQNRHWNQSCEKKAATGREILRVESMGDDIELPEHVDSSGREILRAESMGDDAELRKLLAMLLNVPLGQIGRIRMTLAKQPAFIDVISIITRKDKRHSSEVWRKLEKHSRAVKVDRLTCQFPGERQRPTPVAHDLKFLVPDHLSSSWPKSFNGSDGTRYIIF